MEFMNAMLGSIMRVAQPGIEIGSCLHLSLMMGYVYVLKANDPSLFLILNTRKNFFLFRR